MSNLLYQLNGKKALGKPNTKKPKAQLQLETLEDRLMLSNTPWAISSAPNASVDLASSAGIYQASPSLLSNPTRTTFGANEIISTLRNATRDLQAHSNVYADQAFGRDLPLLRQSLSEAMDVSAWWRDAFETQSSLAYDYNPNYISDSSLLWIARNQLQDAGFQVEYIGATADSRGDLLRARRVATELAPAGNFTIGGPAGFDYLGQNNLYGWSNTTVQQRNIDLTIGVDIQNGRPSFYVGDSSSFRIAGLNVNGYAWGNVRIGELDNVIGVGSADVSMTAFLGFQDSDTDHKVRIHDLANPALSVDGDIYARVALENASFYKHLPSVGYVSWTGNLERNIFDNYEWKSEGLVAPNYNQFVSQVARAFVRSKNQYDPLAGTVGSVLKKELPIIDESVADLIGMKERMGWLAERTNANGHDLSPAQVQQTLSQYGVQIDVTPQALRQFIHGKHINLLSYQRHEQKDLLNKRLVDVNFFGIDIGVAAVGVHGFVEAKLGWRFDVGMGLETRGGFWVQEGSGFGLTGEIGVGIEGRGHVLWGAVAKATIGGKVGFQIDIGAHLADPSPGDKRVYEKEFLIVGHGNFAQGQKNLTRDHIYGYLTADIYAEWRVFWFYKDRSSKRWEYRLF